MKRRAGDDKTSSELLGLSNSRASSLFVGREEELRRLAVALGRAGEGLGRTVLLTGEPGIGKTRLAREALGLARSQGFRVLEGRCFRRQVELAYAPILNAFGPVLRSFSPVPLATLVSDLPDLGRLFGSLCVPGPFFSEASGVPALEKTHLFEAMMRLLERLTQEAPVALFVDDLHWADPATLELLLYLSRGLSGQRALLLGTYSADNSDNSIQLRSLTSSLQRAGLGEEIVIPRLGQDAVHQLAVSILGGEMPGSLLALLEDRACGTPLLVEAFITALLSSGNLTPRDGKWVLDTKGVAALPPNVRQLILDHLERLAPVDRHVLDLIAIMGTATSHTILRAASALEEEAFDDALLRLRAMKLVAESTGGSQTTYSVTHPLVREVACGELPEMARRRAHTAVIEALDRFPGGRSDDLSAISEQTLSRLAYHYHGAGPEANPDRAVAVLASAGERAFALGAHEEAAGHFEAALAVLRGGQGSGDRGQGTGIPTTVLHGKTRALTPARLPVLLERQGDAYERTGRGGEAVEVWNKALVLLSEGMAERKAAGDAVASARLRGKLALAECNRGRLSAADRHVRAGLAVLQGMTACNPCQELVDLHFARFVIHGRSGDVSGVADATAELLAVSQQLQSPYAEAAANLPACMCSLEQGDISRARERALYALRVGESSLDGQELAICCLAQSMLVAIGMCLGDHRFMRYYAEHGLAVARRLGAPEMEIHLLQRLAYAIFLSGDWAESLRTSTEAVAQARRMGNPRDLAYSLAVQAMILALQGDLPGAAARISEVRIAFGSPSRDGPLDRYVFGLVDVADAGLALEWGQAERALGIARSFIRPAGSAATVAARAGLAPNYMPMGLMLLAEAQSATGDPEGALETARDLTALGPPGTPYLTALAARVEGLARQALGQHAAATACLARAQEAFSGLEMPFEVARTLLEQAVSAAGERPELTAKAAQQSLATFERLGAQRYAERARRLLQGLGIGTLATRRPQLGGVPVSERELQIARLVAEGLTTPEIAKRLTLSPGTVLVHLHRMYTRLGIGSRGALARLVIEAGLLAPKS